MWWKTQPTPEEQVLIDAAMRIRMHSNNLTQASPTRIDRAWASIIAETLEAHGWRLEKDSGRIERALAQAEDRRSSNAWAL